MLPGKLGSLQQPLEAHQHLPAHPELGARLDAPLFRKDGGRLLPQDSSLESRRQGFRRGILGPEHLC